MNLKNFDMTQEEKQLLIQDLCARLPYKPRVRYHYYSMGAVAINGYFDEGYFSYQKLEDFSIYPKYGLEKTRVYNILPYLRSMSSIMKEEEEEYNSLLYGICDFTQDTSSLKPITEFTTFLHSHYFDYRGLIRMGLALEAPDMMYSKIICDNYHNND